MADILEPNKNPEISVEIKKAKISLWQTVLVAIITAISGIATGHLAIPHKAEPIEIQGLKKIKLEGKWKYICTSFDGSYQHGGRFIVQKESDGSLLLNGERMWRDTQNTLTGEWKNKDYSESEYLQWHTNWIFVRNDTQMNFEYHISSKDKDIVGYCSGIINSENDNVVSVKGNFYVLNETPILTGQIIFKKINDDDYNSTSTLPKNH